MGVLNTALKEWGLFHIAVVGFHNFLSLPSIYQEISAHSIAVLYDCC